MAPLAPDLDRAALIGYPVAAELFETTTSPSTLYVRTDPSQVTAVRSVLARTVDPQSPNEVDVSRPSDALEARATTDAALRNLLLALGAVALVVGGVGITNVMVISVLERRSEIGVRRALGARRVHVAAQFFVEAIVLAAIGGVGGAAIGAARDVALRDLAGMAHRRPGARRGRRRRRGARRRSAGRGLAGGAGGPPRSRRGRAPALTRPSRGETPVAQQG